MIERTLSEVLLCAGHSSSPEHIAENKVKPLFSCTYVLKGERERINKYRCQVVTMATEKNKIVEQRDKEGSYRGQGDHRRLF